MVEGGFGVVMLHFQKIPRGEKGKGKRKGVRYPPPPPSSHPSEQTPLSNAWREKERDVSAANGKAMWSAKNFFREFVLIV